MVGQEVAHFASGSGLPSADREHSSIFLFFIKGLLYQLGSNCQNMLTMKTTHREYDILHME